MCRRHLILIVLAVLVGGTFPAAAGASGHRDQRPSRVDRIRSYWTPHRMKAARPMPIPTGRIGGAPSAWRSAGERPGYVPSSAPRTTTSAAQEVPLSEQLGQPLSTNGKVFLTDPRSGANYVCSGTALNAVNLSVVWTAGHCTYDGGYFTNWVFVPAYRDGAAPFGIWPALELRAPSQWRNFYNLRYDFGAAVVSTASDGSRLAEVVGGRGFLWNVSTEQIFDAYGYPAASPFTGGRMNVCRSAYSGSDNPPGAGPLTMSISCDMTGGSSGGGWIVGDAINSNISYGRTGSPGKLYGPYFSDTAAQLYFASSGSTAPGPIEPSPSPSPSPEPSPDVTPSPSPSPEPSPEVTPSPSPSPEPSPSPDVTPSPGPSPEPSPSPDVAPSPSPSPEPSPSPDVTPSPSPSPDQSPSPSPEPLPDAPVTEPPIPLVFDVSAKPDPFSPDGDGRKDVARIRFRLTQDVRGTVVVKRHGRRVALLADKDLMAAGRNFVKWKGRDLSGKRVRAGRYVFVIKAIPLLTIERVKVRGEVYVRYR